MRATPAVIVLIHGGQVGGWVWDSVRSQLAGPSIAVDLPAHGGRGGKLGGLRVRDCVDAVIAEFPPSGNVVLVGHSLGAAIALEAANRAAGRIAHLLLIAGMVPNPGEALLSSFPPAMQLISKIVLRLTPEFAQPPRVIKTKLLNGLPPGLADEAAAKFTRESSSLFLDRVDWRAIPGLPVTYVRCLNDRGALSPAFQERLAARLGASTTVVPLEACHYAMLEKPGELARLLNSVAQ